MTDFNDKNPVTVERWRKAAKRYADADRSDPFAHQRALCHIATGIVGYYDNGNEMIEALYDATQYSDGTWGNRVRP